MKHIAYKSLLTIFIFFFSYGIVFSGTWIKSISGKWFYVDEYVNLMYFDTIKAPSDIYHGLSIPLNTQTETLKYLPMILENINGTELWVYNNLDSIFIGNISESGKSFFLSNLSLEFLPARKIKHLLKRNNDGNYELFDAENKEYIITLSEEGMMKYKSRDDVIIMTLE